MSPHPTLGISFDKERPLLPSIHGFEFLHEGGGFSEVAMGPGRSLRPSRIGRGTHFRLPHRDEFRCQRDVFAALGVFSFIRKLRPVENGGDKARAWEIRAKDRTKQSLDGESHRESQGRVGSGPLPDGHAPLGEFERGPKRPQIFEVSGETLRRVVEVESLRPLRVSGDPSRQGGSPHQATHESHPMDTRAPLAAIHPTERIDQRFR